MKGIISEGSDPEYQIDKLKVDQELHQEHATSAIHFHYALLIGDDTEMIIFSDKYCLMAQKSIKYCYRRLNTRSNINLDC